MTKRVLFSATLVRGHIAKFHIPYLKWFKEQGWETWVAANNDYPGGKCEIPYCDHFVDIDFARSPFSKQTVKAYRQLKALFKSEYFDLVHTHTPVGSVLTRLAARDARKHGTKVIYTAHGFHFYSGAPLINWVMWFPLEIVMTNFCDRLITINNEDYLRASAFSRCRVELTHGVGVATRLRSDVFEPAEILAFRERELNLREDDFCVLMIGDINKNKNHIAVIKALKYLPENVQVRIAGSGDLRGQLEKYSVDNGLENRLMFLGFRNDVEKLLSACDLFCLPSFREGLPVSLIEAMACGIPCVATNIRGSRDLLLNTCCPLVEANDVEGFAESIKLFVNDESLRKHAAYQLADRAKKYSVEQCVDEHAAIYESLME